MAAQAPAFWQGRGPVAQLLRPLSCLFGALAARRRGAIVPQRLPVPVIVVGNIAVGGSGKTPVVDWLAAWANAGHRQFFFVDNNFNIPASYAKELCRAILQRRLEIRWQAIIYPMHVDRELAELMAQAGCVNISLGFESGSMPVLQQMNKRFTPDEVRRDLEGLQTMRTLGNNMAYLLKTTKESGIPLPPGEEWIATNFIS